MSNSPTHRTDRILDSDQTNDIHTWIASHRFMETILRDTQDELGATQKENYAMTQLLQDMLPDIEARVCGLREAWPGADVLTALHRNETFVRKINEFLYV